MKPSVALLLFVCVGGGFWYAGERYVMDSQAKIRSLEVSAHELRATLDKATDKARQVLSYTTTPVVAYGKEREMARKATLADFNGERFTDEQIQRSIDALPGLLNDGLERFKLTGAPAYQSSGRIEVTELRGPTTGLLEFMRQNESIVEMRFASVAWEVQDTTPVLHLEYDIWKPGDTAAVPTATARPKSRPALKP